MFSPAWIFRPGVEREFFGGPLKLVHVPPTRKIADDLEHLDRMPIQIWKSRHLALLGHELQEVGLDESPVFAGWR